MVEDAVTMLNAKLGGRGLDGTARFVLEGEGSILVDEAGARAGDGDADVTLTASPETFRAIMTGDTSATGAYMSGRLRLDGDMGLAMRLGSLLA